MNIEEALAGWTSRKAVEQNVEIHNIKNYEA